jgi:hypothetical protein
MFVFRPANRHQCQGMSGTSFECDPRPLDNQMQM